MPSYARLSDRVQMVAVADVNEESARAAAERFHIPHVYTDYREMVQRDDIHVVVVATPNFLHKDATIAALEAGKHVHCEKPLARNAHEAREMVQTARRVGKRLHVSLQWRFSGVAQFLHKYIVQEAISARSTTRAPMRCADAESLAGACSSTKRNRAADR